MYRPHWPSNVVGGAAEIWKVGAGLEVAALYLAEGGRLCFFDVHG